MKQSSPRENGMAPFGKRLPSRHAIIAACYQDEFATNFNLSNWCKYKPLLHQSAQREYRAQRRSACTCLLYTSPSPRDS